MGTLAALLTATFAWPQAIKARRSNSNAAISPASTGIMLASGTVWSCYGLIVDRPTIWLSNISVALAAVVIAAALGKQFRKFGFAAALFLAAAFFGHRNFGLDALGWAGLFCGGAMAIPQAWRALRSPSLEGLSASSYTLLAITAACWLGYGIGIADPYVIAPNVVTLPASVIILMRTRAPAGPEAA